MKENKEIINKFWKLKKNIDRKGKNSTKVRAQEELMNFAKTIQDFSIFGKYENYAQRWANAELVTNSFGKKLFVRI